MVKFSKKLSIKVEVTMTSSEGLQELLKRKGLTPTGDRVKDMALAKSVMPESYKRVDKEGVSNETR